MEKKKIRILIIEDEKDVSLAILEILSKMLESLALEGEFCRITKYEEAKLKLESEKYDIISLDGVLGNNQLTYPLIKIILEFNSKAIAFSLSSDYEQVQSALNSGLCLGFLKNFDFRESWGDQIINSYDLKKIEKALKIEGKISYQVMYKDLINPICIFSSTYADSTPSENWAMSSCNEVALKLNCKQINYSVIDPIGYCFGVYVDEEKVQNVKKIAESSDLKFWAKWSKEYLK